MERKFKIEYSEKGTKEEALEFIRNGGRCIHKVGVWNEWFGYGCRNLDSDKALAWVNKDTFSFKESNWWHLYWLDLTDEDGKTEKYLGFSEPAGRDLD